MFTVAAMVWSSVSFWAAAIMSLVSLSASTSFPSIGSVISTLPVVVRVERSSQLPMFSVSTFKDEL